MWSCFYEFWKKTILFIPHILNSIYAILKSIMIAFIFFEIYFPNYSFFYWYTKMMIFQSIIHSIFAFILNCDARKACPTNICLPLNGRS